MRNLKPLHELRTWLRETGTRQLDLARALVVSEAQMSKFLSGHKALGLEQAVTLSRLTGLPVQKLLKDANASRLLKYLGDQQNAASDNPKGSRNVA